MSTDIIGKVVAGCKITELIGRGGMGIVYKARHLELEQDRALKIMDPGLAEDEGFMKRFRIEAKALAKLRSPNIVTVHDLCETEIGVCLIMEYVPGSTLSEIIKESGPLNLDRIYKIFRQVLTALEHAHAAGVIHRDIKPGNMIVNEFDEVKVTDFGLAKIQQQSATTVTQMTGGTLYYVSPEQVEGLVPIDHRSDLYSVGMSLYEALTGRVPFDKTASEFKISERIVKGNIPPPQKLNPEIPGAVNDFVMKAIARDPARRYQSAVKMRDELEKVEAEEKRSRIAPAKPRRMLYLAGVGALIVVSLLTYLVLRVGGPGQSPAPADRVAVPLKESHDTSGTPRAEVVPKHEDKVTPAIEPGLSKPPAKPATAQENMAPQKQAEKQPDNQPLRLSIFVHDKGRNPIPNSTVRLVGLNGKSYSKKMDSKGMAAFIYDAGKAGFNPTAEITLLFASGQARTLERRKVALNRSTMKLEIDINTFDPNWDKDIEAFMEKGRKFIIDEEWENARTQLGQVLNRRPGQGSAEAYVLMGQAWFEDNSNHYLKALDALNHALILRKEFRGQPGTRLLERMNYYLIVAGYEQYDNINSDDPRRKELKQKLVDQCSQYSQFSKFETYKLLEAKEYNRHTEKVSKILRELRE